MSENDGKARAVYVGGKLVAPGACPVCGGRLVALECQRPTCRVRFVDLQDLQKTYELFDSVAKDMGKAGGGCKVDAHQPQCVTVEKRA